MRTIGTVVRGVRAPIIRENDDIVQIVVDSVVNASISEGFEFHDKDVIGITEAVVARAQGNYATVDDIATDIKNKYTDKILVEMKNIGLEELKQVQQLLEQE